MAVAEVQHHVEMYTVATLSNENKDKLTAFRERIKGKDYDETNSDGNLLRFLVSRQFDFDLTEEKLAADHEWRKTTKPQDYIKVEMKNDMIKMDKSRLTVALPDKSRSGLPVVLVQACRMDKNWAWEDKEAMVYKLIETVCTMVPDDSNFVMLWDMMGLGWNNVDYTILKFAIDLLQNYYPERMAYSYVLNANWLFKIAWAVVAPWLDPRTRSKVVILSDPYKDELVEFVMDEDVLPKKLGGKKDCGKIFDDINEPVASSSWW
eukprot:CAMPEP_0201542130 /NCGR_PEP_ID=MMETSP0161_2-20130828/71862_1 /ASSEMBLY_ACC=CAM_ASM_000251 /TAXON_ID=180227 /ORGANISM="Neoparamoeba aestuarina, Strain SoJaBio B1-5/56/2" /LENGTH=262 /DNA_ID=CAMNT_0047949741 /DNA_START=31 /DNA_END=819 /DNA_ORIENTATION=+